MPAIPGKNDALCRKYASIRELGIKIPVFARGDGTVVDGHHRIKAARKLGRAGQNLPAFASARMDRIATLSL